MSIESSIQNFPSKTGTQKSCLQHTMLDVFGCDKEILASMEGNARLINKLCKLVNARPYGHFLIENFGGQPGSSLFGPSSAQPLSNPIGMMQTHCPVETELASIDITTINYTFNNEEAIAEYVQNFFRAESVQIMTMIRGINATPEIRHVRDTARNHMRWVLEEEDIPNHLKGDTDKTTGLSEAYNTHQAWGQFTCADINNCDEDIIIDHTKMEEFIEEICNKIGVKRYGDPIIAQFSNDSEFEDTSFVQLIETSLVHAHFLKESKRGYLNFYSCNNFHCDRIALAAANFFHAESFSTTTLLRGASSAFPTLWHTIDSEKDNVEWALKEKHNTTKLPKN